MINRIMKLFGKPEPKKIGFEYHADKQFPQYLDICKKDILENLSNSEGGMYVGSEDDGVVVIGYGETKFIRKGFKAILEHPTMKEILLQELEKHFEDKDK